MTAAEGRVLHTVLLITQIIAFNIISLMAGAEFMCMIVLVAMTALCCQGFGLATQEVWIQHATLRENILFGRSFVESFYEQVIDACALRDDLKVRGL